MNDRELIQLNDRGGSSVDACRLFDGTSEGAGDLTALDLSASIGGDEAGKIRLFQFYAAGER